MIKWIGRPILLCLVLAASILTSTAVASAASPLQSTTTITSSVASPSVGEPVTYTITVTGVVNASQDPTGSVTVTDMANSTTPCTGGALTETTPTATSGTATFKCTTSYTAPETGGSILATYSGDGNYGASSGTLAVNVVRGASTTTIAASSSTPVTGQSVVFTATVVPSPVTGNAVTPTGTVAFTEVQPGGVTLPASCASVTLSGSAGKATATCSVTFGLTSNAGATVHAVYSGDTNFTSSTDPTDATVTPGNTDATRVLLTPNASPAVSGQALVFTAQVAPTAPGSGDPSGTVTFSSTNPNFVCTGGDAVTLNASAIATCSVNGDVFTATTGINITANYSGVSQSVGPPFVPGYTASTTTFTATENQDSTVANLIVTPKRVTVGEPVTFTAVLLNPPPGSGPITGEVSFTVVGGNLKRNPQPLNCQGLTDNFNTMTATSGNETTCTLSAVPATANPLHVTVTYYGDTNYLGSSVSKKIRLH
jgi:Bacterial Ig-like domain (group 3)